MTNPTCTNCYDKGYSTQTISRRELSERESQRGKTLSKYSGTPIGSFTAFQPCSCRKGKELQSFIDKEKCEVVERTLHNIRMKLRDIAMPLPKESGTNYHGEMKPIHIHDIEEVINSQIPHQ